MGPIVYGTDGIVGRGRGRGRDFRLDEQMHGVPAVA